MDSVYLRENIAKLLDYARELTIWLDERNTQVDREKRIWFNDFSRDYASRLAREAEEARKAKARASAIEKLSIEEREALGL